MSEITDAGEEARSFPVKRRRVSFTVDDDVWQAFERVLGDIRNTEAVGLDPEADYRRESKNAMRCLIQVFAAGLVNPYEITERYGDTWPLPITKNDPGLITKSNPPAA
ncbi:MAG: hypothetical protein HY554_07455 [Elusimicrobia bacterium]|nr:hypothetical protein [Elusimicrobiota bacterium]